MSTDLVSTGPDVTRGHMNYTEIISFDGSLSKEQVQRWRSIEAEYPPKIRNAQHEP